MKIRQIIRIAVGLVLVMTVSASVASAQVTQPQGTSAPAAKKQPTPPPAAPPPNYVIGADDVLTISVWKEDQASGDVVVRPDGKITLRMGDDITAIGLTIDELKAKVIQELKKFYEEPIPAVTVQLKALNSRRVFITGAVNKPGAYPLTGPMTVLQLITTAGGLLEFADKKNIMLWSGSLKDSKGQQLSYKINYEDLSKGKNPAKNNIELRPGDTVIVR
jgi:polysaccharide export outer membrane protein